MGAGIVTVIVKILLDPRGLGTFTFPTIGASGAIYGVLLACAVTMPHRQVWVFPLPVTVSMRIFVIVMVLSHSLVLSASTGDNVSHVCYLGGMLVGNLSPPGIVLMVTALFLLTGKRRRLKKKFEV